MSEKKNDLYSILGLQNSCMAEEIKAAFFKKLREIGGPERNPSQYKIIREAYDTLSNSKSRHEYDTMSKYGKEINDIIEKVESILKSEKPNYQEAEKLLKKAVVLGPRLGRLRHFLGTVYLELENYSLAYEQLSKAVEYDDANSLYWCDYGFACEKNQNFADAEKSYKKAIEIDPNIPSNNIALAYLYFRKENIDAAFKVLDNAIYSDSKVDFTDFTYFYHKINMMFLLNKPNEAKAIFDKIYEIANRTEDKEYAAWMFFTFARQLQEYNAYDLMIYLTQSSTILSPNDKDYLSYHEYVKENIDLIKELESLKNDSKIHSIIIDIAKTYIGNYGGYFQQDEFDSRIDSIVKILDDVMATYPDGQLIRSGIRTLKQNYPKTYNLNSKLFDAIEETPVIFESFNGNCPHCSQIVIVPFHEYSDYSCPHCNKHLRYSYNGYIKLEGNSNSSSNTNSDCFVLTAVYNDVNHKNVLFMRNYRDKVLLKKTHGQILIKIYYKVGPFLAKIANSLPVIKPCIIYCLENLIIRRLMRKQMNNKSYWD